MWSERDKVMIDFKHVTSIGFSYSPALDPHGDDYMFDWTLTFTMDETYDVEYGYYCDREQARSEALLYARKCWGGEA